MSALPDQFDLWVKKARKALPERQLDYLLGILFASLEWEFINQGDGEKPAPAIGEVGGKLWILVFTSKSKAIDLLDLKNGDAMSFISIKPEQAVPYLWAFAQVAAGILVNPGEYGYSIEFPALDSFYEEWMSRGGREKQGFWIPNLTSEEENFWQEHGL